MSSQSSAVARLSSPAIVALASALSAGLFMVLMPLAFKVFDPVVFPPPWPSQNQDAESAIYLLMVIAVVPGATWLAWTLVRRVQIGANRDCIPSLTALLITLLGLGVLLIRLSSGLPWGDGIKATFGGGLLWTSLALVTLWLAGSGSRRFPARLFKPAGPLVWTAGVSVTAAVLSFVRFGNVDVTLLVAGLLVVAGISLAYHRLAGRAGLPVLPRKWGRATDLLVLILVLLAVPDMVIMDVVPGMPEFGYASQPYVIQFHQALFLGVASQILHGSALLVDTVSQYGVGSIYLIAAFFKLAPINNFTLGFFDGVLTAGVFGLGYGVLRMAGVTRTVSAGALLVAVVALAWGTTYPAGALLQQGAIRFGLPMLLIAAVVAGRRWPHSWSFLKWVALFVAGLSSIWALEAFLYVTFTAAAMIGMGAVWQPPEARLRWLTRTVGSVLSAWVAAHVLFALATLLASGSLPDWSLYLSYLKEFLTGPIGDLTYDVTRWSPSIPVFALYVVSIISLAVIAIGSREFVRGRQSTFIALTGMTAYGVVLFSYYDNRSLDSVLNYVCLPALLVGAIWLGLILDRSCGVSLRRRTTALAVALGLAVLAVANVWPAAGHRGENSLLAYALPGGKSLRQGFHRLWNPPPIYPESLSGQDLIEEHWSDGKKVPVLTRPGLDIDLLDRTQRANALGITDAKENSWVPGPHLDRIERSVADLRVGDLMLFDASAIAAYRIFADGGEGVAADRLASTGLESIQRRAIELIARDFDLKPVDGTEGGIQVVRLVPKPAGKADSGH